MDDLISRWSAIEAIAAQSGVVDKSVAKRVLVQLPSAQQWIPVTERLLEPNQRDEKGVMMYYLVQNEYGDMMVAEYIRNKDGETWWEQMYSYNPVQDEIVAWVPLPEPWKGEDDDKR